MALNQNEKDKLLLFGYIRNFQHYTKLTHSIPDPIVFIIITYYSTNFKVYCIGNNTQNTFEIDNHQSVTLTTNGYLSKYTLSNKMSKQCTDISSITACSSYIIIRNFNTNNIFVTGRNTIVGTHKSIQYLDSIDDKNTTTPVTQHNDYINVISKGIWSENCYMVSKNGIFYSNTTNSKLKIQPFFNKNSLVLKSIRCGGRYVLFVCNNGSVYAYGVNNRGQCGIKSAKAEMLEVPTLVTFSGNKDDIIKIKDISAGSSHNLCVSTDGNVYVFGWNSYGQCGLTMSECDGKDYVYQPKKNEYFKDINVNIVECGAWHSVVMDTNGCCYLFGYNSNDDIKRINNAACGYRHTLLLSNDCDEQCIYSFGRNEQKQCSILSELNVIKKPYKLTKKEIGIDGRCDIVRVIACPYASIIVTIGLE
eukprot:11070_1